MSKWQHSNMSDAKFEVFMAMKIQVLQVHSVYENKTYMGYEV
jgi:hypothetical protein